MSLRLQLWIGYAVVLGLELSFGYYLAHIEGYMHDDAISRVANAFYVLYSRDPHLGALGFVWSPMPSLLAMAPLMFWHIAPGMVSSGLAAVIITAVFSAGAVTLLYGSLRKVNIPAPFAVMAAAAYGLNPFIFVYGANGMSESVFTLFLVWIVVALTEWMRLRNVGSLVQLGGALSLSFWVRYESIALAVAVAVVIVLHSTAPAKLAAASSRTLHARYGPKTSATLLIVLTPVIASILIWLILNYSIVGDPLYFFQSGYSNLAFVEQSSAEMEELSGNAWAVAQYVGRKMLFFSIPLMALVFIRLLSGQLRTRDTVSLLLLACCIPLLQAVMLYEQISFGWLRYFVYPLIVAAAWLPHEWTVLKKQPLAKSFAAVLCVALLLSSFVWRDMNNPAFAREEYDVLHPEQSNNVSARKLAGTIADWLDRYEGISERHGELVLTDSTNAFFILMQSRNPKQFIITNDRNFNEALIAPSHYGVQYFLVSVKEGSVFQAIHAQYPDLFDGGYAWAELIQDFEGRWRLYRVHL